MRSRTFRSCSLVAPRMIRSSCDPMSFDIRAIAAVAGQYYTGTSYPYLYRGALFYADYGGSWMRIAPWASLCIACQRKEENA